MEQRKLGQTTSDMETDALLKKGGDHRHSYIERIKIGSNKTCNRKDQKKMVMMFSHESRLAIIEMGSLELIELKKSRIPCRSC